MKLVFVFKSFVRYIIVLSTTLFIPTSQFSATEWLSLKSRTDISFNGMRNKICSVGLRSVEASGEGRERTFKDGIGGRRTLHGV
jgi:hypothetical protein